MPRVKIEPSGCCENKGLVQVRFAMYLDKPDYGYDKHHIRMPDFTGAIYPGEVDKLGMPVDQKDYDKWVGKLPKVWQNNPFHNHFILISPDTDDKTIADIGQAFLEEAYVKWATDAKIDCVNPPVMKPVVTPQLKADCDAKVQSIISNMVEVKV